MLDLKRFSSFYFLTLFCYLHFKMVVEVSVVSTKGGTLETIWEAYAVLEKSYAWWWHLSFILPTEVRSGLINSPLSLLCICKFSNRGGEYEKRWPSLNRFSWFHLSPDLTSANYLSDFERTLQKVEFLDSMNWQVKNKLSVVVAKALIREKWLSLK